MKAVLPIVKNVWAKNRYMMYCVALFYLPLYELDFICNYDINCDVDGVRISM